MNDGQLNRICHVTQCDGITQAGTDNCGISHLSLVSIQTQPIAFLAVFVYATHTTQAIAFEWKSGFICDVYVHDRWSTNVSSSTVPTITAVPGSLSMTDTSNPSQQVQRTTGIS